MASFISVDHAQPPPWFLSAISAPVERGTVTVGATTIAYRAWGDRAAEGLVLIHGAAAHARWWDHIAPLLALGRRVVALDLSGHGDSGRRDAYSLDLWAREVLTVATDAGIAERPVVIGHSMGGIVALRAASLYGSLLAGVVAIDSFVQHTSPSGGAAKEHRHFSPLPVYTSREVAISRFHPIPDQPVLPYVASHVASASICEVEGGWSWKFDPRIFAWHQPATTLLTKLDCRAAFFRAENGIVQAEAAKVILDRLGLTTVIEIPAACHHVMLDQPLALITGIRTLLSGWH
jgi:pimeloyl-ACP methyl ester carboxylesterase